MAREQRLEVDDGLRRARLDHGDLDAVARLADAVAEATRGLVRDLSRASRGDDVEERRAEVDGRAPGRDRRRARALGARRRERSVRARRLVVTTTAARAATPSALAAVRVGRVSVVVRRLLPFALGGLRGRAVALAAVAALVGVRAAATSVRTVGLLRAVEAVGERHRDRVLAPRPEVERARAANGGALGPKIDLDPVRVLIAPLHPTAKRGALCGNTQNAARTKILLAAIKDGLARKRCEPVDRQIGHILSVRSCTRTIRFDASREGGLKLNWCRAPRSYWGGADDGRLNSAGLRARLPSGLACPGYLSTPRPTASGGANLARESPLYLVLF